MRIFLNKKARSRKNASISRHASLSNTYPSKQNKTINTRRSYSSEHTAIESREHAPDYMIVVLALILIAVGAIIGYTNSPGLTELRGLPADFYTKKQFIAIAIGIVAFFITSRLKTDVWKKAVMPAVISAIVIAIAVRLFGTPIYGAYRWLDIAGISIQAAEVIKFALVLWLAYYILTRKRKGDLFKKDSLKKIFFISLGIAGVVAGLQSDLGSAAVMIAMIFTTLFIAGMPKKYVLYSGLAIIVLGILAVIPSTYRIERVETFLNPSADCQDAGYQVCQALISVGSGGVLGKGLGRSVQAYGYLPEALSDSIFAIIAENLGFFGAAFVVLVFLELFRRLHKIALASADPYHRYLVYMIVVWLASQTAINVGAMIGLLPLKGITLPLISYGGTSIIFVLAALGICFKISRFTDLRAAYINELHQSDEGMSRRRAENSGSSSQQRVFRRER